MNDKGILRRSVYLLHLPMYIYCSNKDKQLQTSVLARVYSTSSIIKNIFIPKIQGLFERIFHY